MMKKDIPKTCGECFYYSEVPYTCHNERGIECKCSKGQFAGKDMRDKSYKNKSNSFCEIYHPIKITKIK